ncbi:hypothetical protein [Streptomyces griseoviridis]|uniref:Uncharacterized protein n=1 Tax=Streptomyces griseoviridis TaxID=45398 RepID=A0ABT9LF56_STRGD|nr:hypothetical protein [Streptomyces griseoviridis]MDP9682361.1 hypothetical protein [Streptomyces griseoviridis]GGS82026.1 hypothetical protein GCM10010240_14260 [Streptomyces griseoviridis]
MTAGMDLLGGGGTITLSDGTEITLRYPLRSLALLEARYGSVTAAQTAIDATGGGAAFGPLIQLIGAGCLGPGGFEPHFREHQDAKGERRISGDITFRRRLDGMDLADLLLPSQLSEYIDTFNAALQRALAGQGNDGAPGETGAGPQTVETISPGLSSTTSPSVSSTFLPAPSGT